MARKQQQRTLKTRQKILDAAHELFEDFGYEQTSVDMICQRAGVAKGTVFAHFSDKASLLTAVKIEQLERLVARMRSRAKKKEGKREDPVQSFIDILKPWLDFFAREHGFTQVFMNQASLKGGEWALRLYEACCALEETLGTTVERLVQDRTLPATTSTNIYVQGITAFFYHVLIGLHSGATQNSADQEALLRGLLTRWLAQDG